MQIKNKRGFTTITLILIIVFSLVLMVGLFVLSYSMGQVDSAFTEIEFDLGNVSFNETYDNTLGGGIIRMQTTVPQIIGTGVLLGMVLTMLLIGYNIQKINRLWILLDIGIIIVAELVAVAVKNGFIEFMNISPEFLAIARDTLPLAAKFVLNLPIIIPTVGVLIMIVTYLITQKKEEEEVVF